MILLLCFILIKDNTSQTMDIASDISAKYLNGNTFNLNILYSNLANITRLTTTDNIPIMLKILNFFPLSLFSIPGVEDTLFSSVSFLLSCLTLFFINLALALDIL